MKTIAALLLSLTAALSLHAATETPINGAGASFPAPAYQRWIFDYNKATGIKLNYQSMGSSAGIQQIKAKTVDFGASDDPLTSEELAENNLMQFPTLIGGIVSIVNIPGVKAGGITLSGPILADIYLGKISNWNDRNIRRLNPSLTLPNLPIRPIYRADGSGTTAIFTDYLCKVSPKWSKGPGKGKSIRWPGGSGGQKNPGVANLVSKISGAIGYVEYAYAAEQNLAWTKLVNAAQKTVEPTPETFSAAAAAADWKNAKDFIVNMTDEPGESSWPITGATYIILFRTQDDALKGKAMVKFWEWCFDQGGASASELKYVPLPAAVTNVIKTALASQITFKTQK